MVLLAFEVGGCRSGNDTPDADEGPCWPIDDTRSEGTVELGTGLRGFEPMPQSLQLFYGNQSGTFLVVHARISGLEPGDPADFFARGNPKTLFTAVLADGEPMTRECPTTLGYKESPDGWSELKHHDIIELFVNDDTRLFDTNVRVIVEIIDAKGRYARDEKVVFAKAPIEEPDGGGSDAGAGD